MFGMVEGSVANRGGLRPQTQRLKEQTEAYVTRMLTISGYRRLVPDRHIDTVAGHYLFQKACLQATAALTYRKQGEKKLAAKLEQSARTYVTLSLYLTPTILQEALGEMHDGDLHYPFHMARRLGISLAQQEVAARGKDGYKNPMNSDLETRIAKALNKEGISKRRVTVA